MIISLYVAIDVFAGTRVCIVSATMVQLSLTEDGARLLRFPSTTLARHYCCGAGEGDGRGKNKSNNCKPILFSRK